MALAPSSAAVERIFSLCNHMFGDAQLSALADYVQGSLMLRAIQQALPPVGLNKLIFLGRGRAERVYGDCLSPLPSIC